MDARSRAPGDHSLTVVTGLGRATGARGTSEVDPGPYLKVRKNRKFMGLQDDLAVLAAGLALERAGLTGKALGERAGLYLTVGYIPFEEDDIRPLMDASVKDGRFSMTAFAKTGLAAVNPLLTFRTLPNMPAFHVSVNFDVQGPYQVGYPGPGQFYLALEEALTALADHAIDVALVGGVADQRNFLVEHHHRRIPYPQEASALVNAAGFLVLERADTAGRRGACASLRLTDFALEYRPFDPFESPPCPEESFTVDGEPCGSTERALGPAAIPFLLAEALEEKALTGKARLFDHRWSSRDGFLGRSTWMRP